MSGFRSVHHGGPRRTHQGIGPYDSALRRHRAWMSTAAVKGRISRENNWSRRSPGLSRNRWESVDFCCAGWSTLRQNGPRWLRPLTCALSGGRGDQKPSPSCQLARSLNRFPELGQRRPESPPHHIHRRTCHQWTCPDGESSIYARPLSLKCSSETGSLCTSVAPPVSSTSNLWMAADGPICNRLFSATIRPHGPL